MDASPERPMPPPERYGTKATVTDGFAIAGFVFGLLGGGILGLIFSAIGLRRIKRDRPWRRGKTLAWIGLVFSAFWTLALILTIAVGLAG